ncbi:MAG: BrnA antitoxin family protein [Blastocatellia bacterium]
MKKEYDFSKGKRGAVIAQPKGKTRITIRIDDEILEWFRQQAHEMGGGNYQTLINETLRQYIRQRPESFEMVMRRVVREELKKMTEKPSRRKAA